MATRTIKKNREYSRKLRSEKSETCTFCEISCFEDQIVKSYKNFNVMINMYPYSLWDGQSVEEHLMVVPKSHVHSISEFSAEAALEYLNLTSNYEKLGYNIWSRAPKSTRKTIAHQHTHLIKPGKKNIKLLLFVAKPYLRLMK